MRAIRFVVAAFCLFAVVALHATIFGRVLGVVHDAQHLPVPGRARYAEGPKFGLDASPKTPTITENSNSASVPIGNYTRHGLGRRASSKWNKTSLVESDTSPVLHFELTLAGVTPEHRRLGKRSGGAPPTA